MISEEEFNDLHYDEKFDILLNEKFKEVYERLQKEQTTPEVVRYEYTGSFDDNEFSKFVQDHPEKTIEVYKEGELDAEYTYSFDFFEDYESSFSNEFVFALFNEIIRLRKRVEDLKDHIHETR